MSPITIIFRDKDAKRHSVRWDAPKGDENVVNTIYITKPHFESAKAIKVTIEEVDAQ